MTLESTIEKTQITFKKPLKKEKAILFLYALAEHFNCAVSYNIEGNGRIDCSGRKFESEEYFAKIGGRIDRLKDKKMAMLQFGLETKYLNDEREPYFTKLKFDLPPGYTIDEINPEEAKFIAEIKEYISKRFNQ